MKGCRLRIKSVKLSLGLPEIRAGKFSGMVAAIKKTALAIVARRGAIHLSSRRDALDLHWQYSNLA
jgi:hypothetical protein